jgi:hypothetical protein
MIDERRAWIRTCTHTLVRDRDADFGRHRLDRRGVVRRMLRVWQAGSAPDAPWPRRYLGRVNICTSGLMRSQVTAVLRQAAKIARQNAPEDGGAGRAARRKLKVLLRKHL